MHPQQKSAFRIPALDPTKEIPVPEFCSIEQCNIISITPCHRAMGDDPCLMADLQLRCDCLELAMFFGCSCKPPVPYHTTLPEQALQHGFEDKNAVIVVLFWNLLAILCDDTDNVKTKTTMTMKMKTTMAMTVKQECYTTKIFYRRTGASPAKILLP